MAKRIKLGIPYIYDTGWIAGAYYIVNIIKALNLLAEKQKPEIKIYYLSNELLYLIEEIQYPFIEFVKQKSKTRKPLPIRFVNKLSRFFIGKNIFEDRLKKREIDYLFPADNNEYYFSLIPPEKRKYWIPDFQEHYLPEFFELSEIKSRKNHQELLVKNQFDIVFSSYSAQKDFFTIYPDAINKTHVIQFAVFHGEDYKRISSRELQSKYNLPKNYFFCANQFWAHKNHITIIKALGILKRKGISLTVAFSGAQTDNRNPDFFKDLLEVVKQNNVEDNVRFLGFIDRAEQLRLMSDSIAIIQPSLFEGWSTVVEDAKALNKSIILSNIPVHHEQIDKNVVFFEPLNEFQLSEIIEIYTTDSEKIDYNQNRKKFAEDIMHIFR